MALAHKPGSVGRVLGVLTAWAGSPKLNQPAIEMAAVLAKAPIILDPTVAMLPEELRLESAKAEQSLWDDDRRKRLRPQAFKMAWLARELAALDAPIQPALIALAKAYVRHRLSPDRPRGWKKAAPEHIASELSGLNRALEDLIYPDRSIPRSSKSPRSQGRLCEEGPLAAMADSPVPHLRNGGP